MTSTRDFERFQDLNFETIKKLKLFSKKPEYRFLVESNAKESATFPYKSALSKANAMIN